MLVFSFIYFCFVIFTTPSASLTRSCHHRSERTPHSHCVCIQQMFRLYKASPSCSHNPSYNTEVHMTRDQWSSQEKEPDSWKLPGDQLPFWGLSVSSHYDPGQSFPAEVNWCIMDTSPVTFQYLLEGTGMPCCKCGPFGYLLGIVRFLPAVCRRSPHLATVSESFSSV